MTAQESPAPQPEPVAEVEKNRLTAGLLAIFLGMLGIHKFYLGDNRTGVIFLLLEIFLFWTVIVPMVLWIIALVEGITLLSMTDTAFNDKYNKHLILKNTPRVTRHSKYSSQLPPTV